jgi:hypothetical protein
MTTRRLSKAEYERLDARSPRFQTFSVADGCALRGRVPQPVYWFERKDVAQDQDGTYWQRTRLPVVSLVIDGWTGVLFYVADGDLESCTFAYNLTPARLAVAAQVMRKAGLARYIRRAAEWALKEVPEYNRDALAPALHQLLRSLPAKDRRS